MGLAAGRTGQRGFCDPVLTLKLASGKGMPLSCCWHVEKVMVKTVQVGKEGKSTGYGNPGRVVIW